MVLTNNVVRNLINDLKGFHIESRVPASKMIDVIPTDHYDLRTISKLEAKRILREDINALIEYGNHYLLNHDKWLYRGEFADFEEADAAQHIRISISILKDELKRRG